MLHSCFGVFSQHGSGIEIAGAIKKRTKKEKTEERERETRTDRDMEPYGAQKSKTK